MQLDEKFLLETAPICTKVISLDRKLQYMSSAGVNGLKIPDITKFYEKPYPAKEFPQYIHDLYDKHFPIALAGTSTQFECPIPDMDGHDEWYLTSFVPAYNVQGKVEYIIASSALISDRKEAEEELFKTNEELKAKLDELEKINELMIDRELKMAALKEEIATLKKSA